MYRDGARVFVEVGPGSILTPLVGSVLSAIGLIWPSPAQPDRSRRSRRLALCRRPLDRRRDSAPSRTAHPRPRGSHDSTCRISPPAKTQSPPPHRPGSSTAAAPARSTSPRSAAWVRAPILESPRAGTLHSPRAAPLPQPRSRPARRRPRARASRRGAAACDRTPQRRCREASTLPARAKRQWSIAHSHETSTRKQPSNGDPVIESFQQTMQMFLEVQRSTMLAYLSGRGAAAPPPAPSFEPRCQGSGSEPRAGRSTAAAAKSGDAGESASATERGRQSSSSGIRACASDDRERRMPRRMENHTSHDAPAVASRCWTAPRSRPGCSRPCAIGPAIRSRRSGSTWIWKPTWESIPSSESRSSARCAMNSRCLKGLSDSAEAMDALARARTLGVIVDRMTSPGGTGERPIRVGDANLAPVRPADSITSRQRQAARSDPATPSRGGRFPAARSTVSASCPAVGS